MRSGPCKERKQRLHGRLGGGCEGEKVGGQAGVPKERTSDRKEGASGLKGYR